MNEEKFEKIEEMNEEKIEEKQYDYEPDTVAEALNWLNKQSELGGEIYYGEKLLKKRQKKMLSDKTITLTDSKYQEMKTVCDEVEYYETHRT